MSKRLSDELGRICAEASQEIIDKENADPDFLPQGEMTCEERAVAGMKPVFDRLVKVTALAIANHRKRDHEEDRQAEMDALSEGMSPEDVSVGLMSFWNP